MATGDDAVARCLVFGWHPAGPVGIVNARNQITAQHRFTQIDAGFKQAA